ncbi:LysM peptidoglycan-binding domain-containing protein [Persicitalea sp.]|uniref:LysM peptidoglycan-binding domain-containing protein n=1 Tax=Persicitalea sp. TaxID=3100273 RepID=UPI0035933036
MPDNLTFGGINVQFNNRAKRLIEANIQGLMVDRRLWESKVSRTALYSPILEDILTQEGVPLDFKYLAVQESSLMPDAVSIVGEVGFWQFKRETTSEMGLIVDELVDERKNIVSSTRAAARLLKRSNLHLNNWVSTLYTYYSGIDGTNRAIPRRWSYAKEVMIGGRADQYVLNFFAHKIAIEAAQQSYSDSTVLLEYRNSGGRTLESIAREFALDPAELYRYNRWLDTDKIPDDRYSVLLPVPASQQEAVQQKLSRNMPPPAPANFTTGDIGFPVLRKVSISSKRSNDPSYYEINGLPGVQARMDDGAADLAKAAKTSLSSFLKYNDLDAPGPLTPGVVYYLAKKDKAAVVPFHVVRAGETIWSISQLYGVRSSQLMKYNRINNSNQRLQIGRLMWLMKQRPEDMPVEIVSRPPLSDEIPADSSGAVSEVDSSALKVPDSLNRSPQSIKNDSVAARSATPVALADQVEDSTMSQPTYQIPLTVVNQLEEVNALLKDLMSSDEEIKMLIVVISKTKELPAPVAVPKSTPITVIRAAEPDLPSLAKSGGFVAIDSSDSPKYHIVKFGQTYFSIAQLYDVEVNDLLAWNRLTTRNMLEVGQRLIVSPVPNSFRDPVRDPVAEKQYLLHKVRPGETLFRISQIYKADMGEIKRLNNMSNNIVILGETMKIPKN